MTTRPAGTPTRVPDYSTRTTLTGWAIFGGITLCVLGVVNFLHGITALQYDQFLTADIVYDNLTFWGWLFLIWGGLQVVAGVLTLMSRDAGPATGMVLGSIGIVFWFFMIFAAPGAAILGIALSMAVVASLATAYAD
jgi:hypothetical protein